MELTLSPKSTNKSTSFKDKFEKDNVAQFMGADYSFTSSVGKNTKKKGKTVRSKAKDVTTKATKIAPLEQSNAMSDMLSKILTFMQKTHDDEQKARELLNNYQEENILEAGKRHKELLEALKNIKIVSPQKETAEKVEEVQNTTNSILQGISDIVPNTKVKIGTPNKPSTITKKTTIPDKNPAGGAAKQAGKSIGKKILGKLIPGVGVALDAADAWQRYQEGDRTGAVIAALGAVGGVIPGIGPVFSFGAAGANLYRDLYGMSAEEVEKNKEGTPKNNLDQTGKKGESPKTKPADSSVKANGEQSKLAQLHEMAIKNGSSSLSTPVAPVNNVGEKLSTMSSENAILPLLDNVKEEIITNVNNMVNSGGDNETASIQELHFVRNQEPTFMRMIYQSTRVV